MSSFQHSSNECLYSIILIKSTPNGIKLLICDLPKSVTHTHTHTHTHRLSSLPSQCLLATASNPLHLSLVHSAGEAAGLVRSISGFTTSHMECGPSQQHLGQLPCSHLSVWLFLQMSYLRVSSHSDWLTIWTQAERRDLDLDPDQRSWCALQSRGYKGEGRRWKLRNTLKYRSTYQTFTEGELGSAHLTEWFPNFFCLTLCHNRPVRWAHTLLYQHSYFLLKDYHLDKSLGGCYFVT